MTKNAAIPKAQRTQVFLGALAGKLAAQAVVASLVHDNIVHALPEVEVDLLRHETDAGLGSFEIGVDVVPEYLDFAT